MNKNEKFVISINREMGSGGRTIGEKLAEKLGVQFYDKALINALVDKYHLTVEEIEKLKGQNNSWWSNFARVIGIGNGLAKPAYYHTSMGAEPELLTTEEMFRTEKEILKGIAQEESCVITGRTGFYVFRDKTTETWSSV